MNKQILAIQYAEKALKINNKNGFAYNTLAETYGMMGDDRRFYQNVELALKCGFPVWEQVEEAPYNRYHVQDKFKKLVKKYRR